MKSYMLAVPIVLALLTPASGGMISFFGIDPGADADDPRPNSAAAAASFAAAAASLGPMGLVDFEDLPQGNFDHMIVVPGIQAALFGTSFAGGIVTDGPLQWMLGFNTTGGGDQFLRVSPSLNPDPAGVTFNFKTPIQAFGVYITGLGSAPGDLTLILDGQESDAYAITGHPRGGVLFFGIADNDLSIQSVRLELATAGAIPTLDVFGVDDIQYTNIPEPATVALLAIALLALGLRRR